MSFFERLQNETQREREIFITRPLIQTAIQEGVSVDLYRDYLTQAYHHVKFTCPLLGLALSQCPVQDRDYRAALIEYIDEEKGHEEWILNDIEALGGNKDRVRNCAPNLPNKAMCAYVHYAITNISPYALMGMVHVLEGMSVVLADKAAETIRKTIAAENDEKGFSYLKSHGALDQEHVVFFENTVNKIQCPDAQQAVIDTAKMVYRLWGDMFDDLWFEYQEKRDAA